MPQEPRAIPEMEEPVRPKRQEELMTEVEKPVVANAVRLNGHLARGVIRGRELIDRFADRLEGMLGFRPYSGTLNIKVERPIDIEDFETKRIQHILLDGSLWIDARLAPIKMEFRDKVIDAWIIIDERGLHEDDVLEVIHKDRLVDKYGMQINDEVTVELVPVRRGLKSRLKARLRWLWPRSTRTFQ